MGFGFIVGCGARWPTCASTGSGGCKLGWASRPPCRRPTASGTIRLCFKRLSAAASTWWRAGSGEWAERAPAPARYRCPFGCSPTTWPGGAAWCRAALGRGLVVVWLYERPGLAFPYPLRVHPVRCLPAAWLHSSVATCESASRGGPSSCEEPERRQVVLIAGIASTAREVATTAARSLGVIVGRPASCQRRARKLRAQPNSNDTIN